MIANEIKKYLNSINYSWKATITPYGGTFYFHNDKETAKNVINHMKELGYNLELNYQQHIDGELDGLNYDEIMYYITWRN